MPAPRLPAGVTPSYRTHPRLARGVFAASPRPALTRRGRAAYNRRKGCRSATRAGRCPRRRTLWRRRPPSGAVSTAGPPNRRPAQPPARTQLRQPPRTRHLPAPSL